MMITLSRFLLIWTLCILPGPSVVAGTIIGRIYAEITPEDEGSARGDQYASRRYRLLEKIDYDSLRNFVVHIDEVKAPVEEGSVRAVVSQVNGTFSPSVMPIAEGSTIIWPNKDSIFHNVFSMSETTPFDLGYYKNTDKPKEVTFTKTGRVDVFCSIHSEMNCIVLVLPNPWFALADRKGHFTIRDVPPGNYKLRGWQERLPPRVIEIVVPEDGDVEVDLPLGFAYLPKM